MLRLRLLFIVLVISSSAFGVFSQSEPSSPFAYFRIGNAVNIAASPRAGFALMGGGSDLDEAFRWLCGRAGGGDLLVLRAAGDDDYNKYIQALCHLNSVATIVIPSRAAATDPFVEQAIRKASAIFISGGDQAKYLNFWQGTPVQAALNDAIRRGVPLGGTSAGLAVLGEYAYTAQGDQPDDPNLDAKTAMADPFGRRITLAHNFVEIPLLKGILTDTHFARRDRMGRLLTFLARLNQENGPKLSTQAARVRGIGVEQGAAVLLEPDSKATVVGMGSAYFVDASNASGTVVAGKPVTYGPFTVEKVAPGHAFDVKLWTGDAVSYKLSVHAGEVQSSQPGNAQY